MLPIHWICIFLSMKKMWKLCFSEEAVKVFYIKPIDKAPKREIYPTSLVFLCLRICLSMEGTWSQCRSQEAPTFCRATQQESRTAEAPSPRTGALQQENPRQWEASALWWRAAARPTTREPRSSDDPTQPSVNQSSVRNNLTTKPAEGDITDHRCKQWSKSSRQNETLEK